jgi:ABC-type uncharacterized transport system ATPase subunit
MTVVLTAESTDVCVQLDITVTGLDADAQEALDEDVADYTDGYTCTIMMTLGEDFIEDKYTAALTA